MSLCILIAADKPLPLCSRQTERSRTVMVEGEVFAVSALCGFAVEEHDYYRNCVNALGYPIKDYRYELRLDENEADLQNLRDYLSEQFDPGETVELWGIWVSDYEGKKHPVCQTIPFQKLDMAAVHVLCNAHVQECRLSVII